MSRADLARRMHAAAHLTGEFTLRSGAVSDVYFDKYRLESDPRLLAEAAEVMAGLIPDGIDALAGLELGGVPLAVAISAHTGIPARFVRKEAKAYGTANLAEGGDIDGLSLCVVEDVVTSGGQLLASCADLRDRGAKLAAVICLVDRESGGTEALAAEGLELRAAFTMSELTAAAGSGTR